MGKYRNKIYGLVYLLGGLLCFGCIEEIRFETESFESLLVVDATITDEEKQHIIYLSRTFPFEDFGPSPLSNATVELEGDGIIYAFNETEPGSYMSELSFTAVPNVSYSLHIRLEDGESYVSDVEQLTPRSRIDSMYVVREINNGIDGASIYVDATGFATNASYFRYEYIETFRLIPPLWREEHLRTPSVVVESPFSEFPCGMEIIPRSVAEQVCYRTENSNEIELATTNELSTNSLERHRFRFIPKNDYRIGHRYSVLLRQLAINGEAYEYFSGIKGFSSSESVFSQVQAGFLNGNIRSVDNSSEKVVGYFGVASVTTKRLFFNFVDHFQGEPIPDYIVQCAQTAPAQCDAIVRIAQNFSFLKFNDGSVFGGPYIVVPRACGYASAVGSLEVPDFWVE